MIKARFVEAASNRKLQTKESVLFRPGDEMKLGSLVGCWLEVGRQVASIERGRVRFGGDYREDEEEDGCARGRVLEGGPDLLRRKREEESNIERCRIVGLFKMVS